MHTHTLILTTKHSRTEFEILGRLLLFVLKLFFEKTSLIYSNTKSICTLIMFLLEII